MATLGLTLFGAPVITLNNQPIHIGRRKAVALLAYLAVSQRAQSRAHLASLLWPAYDEAGARAELRRALSALNQALGAGWLEADRNTVTLAAGELLQVDVLTFRRHLAAARTAAGNQHAALLAAVDLAQAELLSGFTLDDAPDFEEWQRFEAAALRRELAWALEQLSQPRAGQESMRALEFANRWLALDLLDEAAHRRMIELHATAGDFSAAYRHYQECKEVLNRELGVPPAVETTALYEQIRAGAFPTRFSSASTTNALETQSPAATLHSPSRPPNLPAHVTPFVGRAHELRELATMLAGGQRLVTLTGPGGIGKTRLALQVAHNEAAAARWRDGVYFIDMTAVETGELLVVTLADGLGAALAGNQPLPEQLVGYLRHKQLLLVFDNLEQLLAVHSAATVATLFDEFLLHAPGVTMLITSRERLNLHGETVFNLLGMPFPPAVHRGDGAPDSTLAAYDAIRLFCQSAQRADRAFQLATDNQEAVVQICQLVQGMPLAIDLAAAWVRILTCGEIATEIAQNINFLATSAHNLPARHRSMAAVFQHSWQLLSAQEQAVFIRLACFRGGCTRDAAQAVTGATLPTLSMLVDKSLLRRTQEGRFVMHELLRQFAAEKLAQEDTAAATMATRHSAYYLALLARWEAAFLTHERMTAFRTLQPELDNIRYAWDWAVQQQDVSGLAQGLHTLYTLYLEIINGFDAGIQRFGQAIAMAQSVADQGGVSGNGVAPRQLLARLQARSAQFHLFTGKIEEAAALFAASLATLCALDDQPEVAFVLTRLAMARLWQGNLQEARTLVEEALAICRQHPVPGGLQAALTNYGYIAQQSGDFALAEALNQECLSLLRVSGDPDGLASTLGNLGLNYVFQEQYEQALPHLEEALAISKSIGNRSRIAIALANLMDIYMKVGRLDEARRNGVEALAAFTDLGQRQYAAILESSIGYLALAEGDAAEEGADHPASAGLVIARTHFCRALTIANEIDVDLIRVYGVTGFGELLARIGEHERATALLTLAVEFPTTDPDITGRAEARLRQLASVLPDQRYQQAQRQGRSLSLSAVAAELLAEFQSLGQQSNL
jgi:predicted ATPase/DNA-binding SARP family transcriptional activator/Tfp pilus assembly protein PilF